ncbi:hypothetical protein NZD89_08060 [Alicyclobacillus fastidiosus]|uniref:Uncharacterized protein n=1 Tax=Alicyclobacillus fastidiosus TaxID=392011 RepID=A0ABY6ZML4_9BACL|nr:hypothetical protein [Alicyclobacillus fastidiosus]WAH43334.1 hypothetical protein NZD89_08060 [Alicyclobacillus fastidiosus]GMA65391.1 hypothetical protein GCM10025859_58310 [Alicyclobacillus fastidiosus]
MYTLWQIIDYLESSDYRSNKGRLIDDPVFFKLRDIAKEIDLAAADTKEQEAIDEC